MKGSLASQARSALQEAKLAVSTLLSLSSASLPRVEAVVCRSQVVREARAEARERHSSGRGERQVVKRLWETRRDSRAEVQWGRE